MDGERVPVVVSVADDRLDRIPELLEALVAGGLVVDHVLDAVGVITGSIEPTAIEALAALPGVASVERQRTVRIPPPDSDVQ
jgi:hypothetical protein